ncbi:MAG: DinB family protein [Cyclobacteriaceae bacterium]
MKDRWTNQLDEITQDFMSAFSGLTTDQLNWKPNPNTWSVGQNVDHLIVINSTYFPVMEEVRNGSYKLPLVGRLGFMVSFLGKTVLKAVQPDRRKKMKTFPIWEPAKSDIQPDLWERFETHQEEVKKMISSSLDLLDKGTVISSPANSNIVYKLETAFDIIVAHERRHWVQAREVKELMR